MKKYWLCISILLCFQLTSCYKKIPRRSEEPLLPLQKEEALPDEAQTKDLPFRPYENALTALKSHNYSEAKRWFSITISDFPNSDFAKMAKVMNSVILLSEELGNLRSLKLWNEKNESLKTGAESA